VVLAGVLPVALDRQPELTAVVKHQQSQTFGLIFGLLFLRRLGTFLPAEPETLRAPSHAEAAVSVALACLVKAETEATVEPTALTQPAMALEVVVEVAQQMEGTDLMDICVLLTGALTDGNL
jgi:hypothetical protein